MLTGYTDRLSVTPGSEITIFVSTTATEYQMSVVELIHGDQNPAGPGHKEIALETTLAGRYKGRVQHTYAGSYGIAYLAETLLRYRTFTLTVFMWTRAPSAGRRQGVIALLADEGGDELSLDLTEAGTLAIHAGGACVTTTSAPLPPRAWYFVAAGIDLESGRTQLTALPLDPQCGGKEEVRISALPAGIGSGWRDVLFGASGRQPSIGAPKHCFSGKLEAPAVYGQLMTFDECCSVSRHPYQKRRRPSEIASWDFAQRIDTQQLIERRGRHGRLINMPARGCTGVLWRSADDNPQLSPRSYGAIHFHEDDLADANWEPDATWRVPPSLRSGVYAIRLESAEVTDYLPFVVRPRTRRPTADVALLVPTFTYLAYANERTIERFDAASDAQRHDGQCAGMLLKQHPEFGVSLYDLHSDGSGCCYASRLRPLVNVRPDYRFWVTGGPERLPADLYLVDWLKHNDIDADVITDDDLHAEGYTLLDQYRVVVTGSHPEYVSEPMLDALETFVSHGGRLMYLGGNGFYWVTSVAPDSPHIIEVRRGVGGTRMWESAPGELHHSTTGEPGGLWRHRGRPPNRLVGVGFAAQSDARDAAVAYRRLPDSYEPEAAFIFEGVKGATIGAFGLLNGGAAGYEIDRVDSDADVPGTVWHLATSAGQHSDSYLLAVEDQLTTQTDVSGTTSAAVRADMVYVRTLGGGEVFSVGSCNWCGALSHDQYCNAVAQITANVLARFRDGPPRAAEGNRRG